MTAYRNLHPYQTPPPYALKGARMSNFMFLTSEEKLQAICDKWLNNFGTPWVFQPIGPFAQVVFVDYEGTYSIDPPYNAQGFNPYREAIISLYVGQYEIVNGEKKLVQIYSLVDYCWVNSDFPMLGGQLVYGMQKLMGDIHLPDDTNTEYNLQSLSLKNFGPRKSTSECNILNISPLGNESILQKFEHGIHAIEDMMSLFSGKFSFSNAMTEIKDFLEVMLTGATPFVSLRQLRSISDPSNTAISEIIVFNAKVTHTYGFELLSTNVALNIQEVAYFPVMEDYGWTANMQPIAGFRVHIDFIIENGKTLYTNV